MSDTILPFDACTGLPAIITYITKSKQTSRRKNWNFIFFYCRITEEKIVKEENAFKNYETREIPYITDK